MPGIKGNLNLALDASEIGRLRRDRANASNLKQRTARREYIQGKKAETPCTDCGKYYPYYVMDYAHVRGDKLFNLSKGPSKGFADIDAEIAKCDLVCSNCHRERTNESGL